MGFPCFARRDPRRYPLSLFDLVLGGGMGSRLFNEVRERRGLAYTVASSTSLLIDGGFLHIYGSTAPERLDHVLELCQAEFERLVVEGPTEEEVETARHQFERSFLLALDSNPFRSMRNIDPVLYGLERLTEEEVLARIRALSRRDVMALAAELFDKVAPTVSLVGPVNA
jgi:predicted Zn-dependent peptidase